MMPGVMHPVRSRRPLVLGHRGFAARYPENTLLSFRKALEAGADGVECDVQKTADGRFVVIHDASVERTSNGHGQVADLALESLRHLDFGGGERIPTLEEMLAVVSGTYLDLELKEETLTATDFPAISTALRAHDKARLMISSFKPELLFPFRRHGYTVGLLLGEEAYQAGATAIATVVLRLRPQFLNLPVQTMERIGVGRTQSLLRFLRFLGISVLWWTVNTVEAAREVMDQAAILVTDDPEILLSQRPDGALQRERPAPGAGGRS